MLALAGFCAARPLAAEEALLRWKFEPGLQLRYAFPQTTTSTARVDGRDLATETKSRGEVMLVVDELDGPERARVQLTLQRMKIEIRAPQLGLFYYDSAGRQRTKGYMDNVIAGYDALARRPFRCVLDTRGTIVSVGLSPADRADLAALPEKLPLDSILTPRGASQLLGLSWPKLPERPVSPGDTWEESGEALNLALGLMTARRTYTYEGPVERNGQTLDKIDVVLELTASRQGQEGGVQFEITAQDNRGTAYFDRQLGRFVEGQTKLQLTLDTTTKTARFDQRLVSTSSFVLLGAEQKRPGAR